MNMFWKSCALLAALFLGGAHTAFGQGAEPLLQGSIKDWVGANYTVELDIEKLGDKMMERIEEKRAALGI